MALVVSAARPWQAARHKCFRPKLVPSLSYRYESTFASSETLFPWRHSAEPIKRVVDGDNLSGVPIDKQKDTFFQEVMLASMLQRDWYELLLPSVWKDSLANDCAWAFQKGVAALLSHTFRVPIDNIDKEEEGIVFDADYLKAMVNKSVEEDTENVPRKGEPATDRKLSEEEERKLEENEGDMSEKTDLKTETEEKVVEDSLCSKMLEKKLIELYGTVDPTKMDLLLCMKPLSSKLENVFGIIFTREAVEEDPSLVQKGRSMRIASRVTRDPYEVNRMLQDLDAKGKPISLFTMIVDVSIQCFEIFAVKDKSGKIMNGSAEPQEVTHLVRFEVVTNLNGGKRLGSWRIVDWDDLLEGNVWY